MEDGQIVEQGTHGELLDAGGAVRPPVQLAVRRRRRRGRLTAVRRAGAIAGVRRTVRVTKSRSTSAKRDGSSRCGQCPASAKTSNRLPGMARWARSAWTTGMTRSWPPHTSIVGDRSRRYRRSVPAADWPRWSATARSERRNVRRAVAASAPVAGATRRRPRRRSEAIGRLRHRPQHEVGAGQRGGTQPGADLVAQTAARHQHQALDALGELVTELHGHTAAVRVPDDRRRAVPEGVEQVAHDRGGGAQRVVAVGGVGAPMTGQVGRHDRAPRRDTLDDVVPHVHRRPEPVDQHHDGLTVADLAARELATVQVDGLRRGQHGDQPTRR